MDILNIGDKNLREYRPVLMWYWNDAIEEEEITRQLEEFYEQGIYEFFVHPMQGLAIEYLSDEFFKLIAYTVKEAKRIGMKYWIYDEYCWPSGTAGRQLVDKYPWSRGSRITEYRLRVPSFLKTYKMAEGEFVAAFLENGDIMEDITDLVEVTVNGDICKAEYLSRSMSVTYARFYFKEKQQTISASMKWGKGVKPVPGYLDTMNPDAVKKFIELTHEEYKKWIGDEFGKTVKGVFDDEAIIMGNMDCYAFNGTLVWNDILVRDIMERFGYDIRRKCWCLYAESKTEEIRTVKRDYWNYVKESFITNYFGQMSEWCKKNNLLFTGHIEGEENLKQNLLLSGDVEMALSHFDVPGIDSIYSAIHINDDPNFCIAAKIGASTAKFFGKERLLCETFTGSGSDMRMRDMKRIINKLTLLGVNMLQYMAAYYSLDEGRKGMPMCYQPSHGYANPLFKYYKKFGDYAEIIQYLSSITKPAGKILVITPLVEVSQTMMHNARLEKIHDAADKAKIYYENIVNGLIDNRVEFDILSEDLMPQFSLKNGNMAIRDYQYDFVIFPGVHYFDNKIADFVKMLLKSKTKLIFLNGYLDINVDDKFNNPFLKEKQTQKIIYVETINEVLEVLGRENIILDMKTDYKVLASLRENDDFEIAFVANDEDKYAEIDICTDSHMQVYNIEKRELHCDVEKKNDRMKIVLEPYQMVAVIKDKNKEGINEEKENRNRLKDILLTDFEYRAENNLLPLAYSYKFDDNNGWIDAIGQTDPSQWLGAGGRNEETGHDLGSKCCFRHGQNIKKNTNYSARSVFYIEDKPSKLSIFIETASLVSGTINGKELSISDNARIWGPKNCVIDISEFVNKGKNVLCLECRTADYNMIYNIPFACVVGDFKIKYENGKEVIAQSTNNMEFGSYTDQGYPYYVGDYGYIFEFETDNKYLGLVVDTQEAFELYVNEKFSGQFLWCENEIDISKFVRVGHNTIRINITSPLSNLLESKMEIGIMSPPIIRIYDN